MDVVVIGEPLMEFSAARPLGEAVDFHLSFSGDALNASVAAAATGAHVALVTRVGRDEFGERLIAFAASHGVDTRWMLPGDGPTGAYVVGADPTGERAFAYLRSGSAASRMTPADLDAVPLAATRVLLLSGITAAISASCDHVVRHAAEITHAAGGKVVYDPNYRSRLTTPEASRATLAAVAPHTTLLTPSCPGDSLPLLNAHDPLAAARACHDLGAPAAAVTRGPDGVLLSIAGEAPADIPAFPAPEIVDQTGAGDAFAGALAARLSHGSPLPDAIRAGMAAAAISLSGQGGTGRVAAPEEIEDLLRRVGIGRADGHAATAHPS
ncbi:sugar kinase [Thermopolyspora sp. NPDC052614]|uniref:sugar kinase n=1 Tax=Thermopolyspora sp. NPDC052614 TaxID=3155682 RepID=UPI003427F9BE